MKKKVEKEIIDSNSKNPNNWKGIFYVNSKDPRIIVPKINSSFGWTLNFGHKNGIFRHISHYTFYSRLSNSYFSLGNYENLS